MPNSPIKNITPETIAKIGFKNNPKHGLPPNLKTSENTPLPYLDSRLTAISSKQEILGLDEFHKSETRKREYRKK